MIRYDVFSSELYLRLPLSYIGFRTRMLLARWEGRGLYDLRLFWLDGAVPLIVGLFALAALLGLDVTFLATFTRKAAT